MIWIVIISDNDRTLTEPFLSAYQLYTRETVAYKRSFNGLLKPNIMDQLTSTHRNPSQTHSAGESKKRSPAWIRLAFGGAVRGARGEEAARVKDRFLDEDAVLFPCSSSEVRSTTSNGLEPKEGGNRKPSKVL